MDDIFDLGIPGPSGNENDTYVAVDTIYKVNNLLNSGGICKLLDKILKMAICMSSMRRLL
jgi:hypothetical protein